MNAVIVLLSINLIVGLCLMVLHSSRRFSWILATASTFLIGLLLLFGPLDQPISIGSISFKLGTSFSFLGRQLVVDSSSQAALAYIYLASSFLFGGGWIAKPSRFFYSAGTFALLAVALSLMVEPFLYAAIFLEVAALAAIFVIVDPARPAIRAALRLLLFYSLGMMAILMSGWLLGTAGVTTGAPLLVERVLRFLAIGFGVLLMVPPFHMWLTPAADQAEKYSFFFSVVLLHAAGLFILLRFLNEFEWMRTSALVAQGIRGAGIVMIIFGGMWALAQRRLPRAVVFLLLADFGVTMIMVSLQVQEGYSLALVISGARIISIGLWGLGYSLLARVSSNDFELRGAAYTNPLPVAAMLIGLFSIGGVPLTAGFPGRWGGIQLASGEAILPAIVIVFGIAMAIGTGMRWVNHFLREPATSPPTKELLTVERNFLWMGIGLCLTVGIFPQLLFPWISQAVLGLQNLIK